jgi:glyoxylase-like metal-dependent hydrolase (beta-lactamase superfamily II)
VGQAYLWQDPRSLTLIDTGPTDAERHLYARVVTAAGIPAAPAARVDIEVGDGDLVDFGAGATVVGAPGHTDGSIAVNLPEHRLIFTGDSAARTPDGRVVLGPFSTDRDRAIDSLRRLAELDADVACFGHGDPVMEGASGMLRSAADRA